MSILSAFNTQLENLAVELQSLFPKDKNILNYVTAIQLLKKNNPRKLHTMFKTYIYVYKQEIMSTEETFFLKNSFNHIANNDSGIMIMKSLKQYWTSLSDKTKSNIWLYLKVLIRLAEKMPKKSIEQSLLLS